MNVEAKCSYLAAWPLLEALARVFLLFAVFAHLVTRAKAQSSNREGPKMITILQIIRYTSVTLTN